MSRIVVAEYVTLDGVMEDPGPSGAFAHRGWTVPYWNDELAKFQSDQLFASDALLLGRVTFDEFAAAWPLRSGDPFTDRMNSLPKFVASATLEEPLAWNATLLTGELTDEVAKLKEQPGKDILIYGSSSLVNALLQHDLIDEFRIMLYPLVLGSGKRFFRDGSDNVVLGLEGAEMTSTGVALLTYRPARAEGKLPYEKK
jgi:dihydrofolate reductase